jgi:PAS domain S-box-containing protein
MVYPLPSPASPDVLPSEDTHRILFQASPLPMWVYDLETLRFLDVNEVACRKYGWSREEFLQRTILDIRPPEDAAAVRASVRDTPPEVFNSGIWRHRLRDGTVIDVEITSHELQFLGRRARFVCPIDVTQRFAAEAALRESEALLRRAQALARLAHAVSRPDGSFESWSESAPGLIGVSPDNVPKSTREYLALVHADDREAFRRLSIEAAQVGARVDFEYRLLRPAGGLIHLRQVIEPIEDGGPEPRRWFCTVQDVTEQKLAEARVRQANEELELRVRERTAQLEVSNRELALASAAAERANRAKSEFLSSMSHELRTPLNAIIGFGQLLAMPEVMARHDSERATFVEHIVDAGRHLLALINEILNLAQIEAGKLSVQLERVPVAELLAECEAMMAPLAVQRGVTFETTCAGMPDVRADRVRVKQVLLNLMSNAIKYNREGGSVHVDCDVVVGAPAAGPRVQVAVRDTGTGLDAEQLASLFQPFNRLGQERGSSEGSGIGLVVTKRLVELMGGSIAVESQPGVGSVFRVDLPMDTGEEPPAPTRAAEDSDRKAGDSTRA